MTAPNHNCRVSKWLCRDLLDSSDLQLSLDEAAEIARHRLGEEEVNRYLYQQFSSFSFGTAHLALVQLPWDVMYTTNYDLLVENAAKAASIEPSGIIQPIFSTKTELTPFSEKHILYYHSILKFFQVTCELHPKLAPSPQWA